MAITIGLDQSKNVELVFRKGEGRLITLNFRQDSTPYDTSGIVFVFQVLERDSDTIVFELTEDSGGGLTNGGASGILSIEPADADVDIPPVTYEWKLKADSETWFHGLCFINNSPPVRTLLDEATVELDLGEITVDVELTVLGFDPANLTTSQLQTLATALGPYLL